MRTTLAGLGTLLVLTAATAQADVKEPKCFEAARDGHCVAVQVNGQRTVKISKKTKKMLKDMAALNLSGGDVSYEVPQVIRGALQLNVDWIPEAVAYFGAQPEVSAIVYPLDGQNLETRPELSSDSSVRAGGSAVLTRADVVQDNRLPPGRYVVAIRVHGSRYNWDRQTLFFQVAE